MCVYVVFKPQRISSEELSCISLSALLRSTAVETMPPAQDFLKFYQATAPVVKICFKKDRKSVV